MKKTSTGKKPTIHSIPFEDNSYQFSRQWLEKYADSGSKNSGEWLRPTLKFLSFQEGQLTLLNSCENRSFHLTLQVQDKHLLVGCNCDNKMPSLCNHAYEGLSAIIWKFGERYFEKLRPGGAMELAFVHKICFDKKESTAGITVSPRPELNAVFNIESDADNISMPEILQLPGTSSKAEKAQSEQALSYLIIIPFRNKIFPALLPSLGRLNKNRTEIKTWDKFLTGIQKDYQQSLTDSQKELNTSCYHLWKMVETRRGSIIAEKSKRETMDSLQAIFSAWQKILPLLRRQQFVYTYSFYGVRELKYKPARRRTQRAVISDQIPLIEFLLSDKGAFYQFHMRVRVNGKILSDYDASAAFFIQHEQTIYMLPSLRDAALAEWLYQSGGWITVFKEHYQQFEKEVLSLLKESYKIETMARIRKQ